MSIARFQNQAGSLRAGCLIIVLLLLLALPSAAAADSPVPAEPGAAQGIRFEPSPCMFDLPLNWVEGQDVDCGYLVVPEQHADPAGPTIRLAVAIVYSLNPNPQPDPLVMLQGGPGGSTIDTYIQMLPLYPDLRADRDLILFDQRGTLYSQPALTCPEIFDLTVETLDQDLPEEEENQLFIDALTACTSRLESQGVNLSAFDSLENAADVQALSAALGYDQYNLYGVSYGTLLAQHVMRDYPEGLRSVVLDSVVPPQTNFLLTAPHTKNDSFEALFSACAADAECNQAYPNLREVFYEQVDRLNAEPAKITLTDIETGEQHTALLDGDFFMNSIFKMLYLSDVIPLLPTVIYDARADRFTLIERIESLLTLDRSMAYGFYYTVMCSEDADFSPEEYDLTGLPEQIVAVDDTGAELFIQTCQALGVEPLGAEADAPPQTEIPTLVMSGAFDPITPPQFGAEAARTLPNSYEVVFPAGGHGAIGSGDCQNQVMVDFLNNPSAQPDTSCVDQMSGPAFTTPASLVSLPVLGKLLNLQDGTAWQLGLYVLGLLFLLTALVIYPIVWLVRLLRRKPAPVEPAPTGVDTAFEPVATAPARRARPGIYRAAPWLAAAAALLLLVFTVILVVILVNMISANDTRVLVGLPGSARPLFILPLLAGLFGLLMLISAFAAWASRAGSIWGRLYLTFLSIAALVCVAVLGVWGMLTALVV